MTTDEYLMMKSDIITNIIINPINKFINWSVSTVFRKIFFKYDEMAEKVSKEYEETFNNKNDKTQEV